MDQLSSAFKASERPTCRYLSFCSFTELHGSSLYIFANLCHFRIPKNVSDSSMAIDEGVTRSSAQFSQSVWDLDFPHKYAPHNQPSTWFTGDLSSHSSIGDQHSSVETDAAVQELGDALTLSTGGYDDTEDCKSVNAYRKTDNELNEIRAQTHVHRTVRSAIGRLRKVKEELASLFAYMVPNDQLHTLHGLASSVQAAISAITPGNGGTASESSLSDHSAMTLSTESQLSGPIVSSENAGNHASKAPASTLLYPAPAATAPETPRFSKTSPSLAPLRNSPTTKWNFAPNPAFSSPNRSCAESERAHQQTGDSPLQSSPTFSPQPGVSTAASVVYGALEVASNLSSTLQSSENASSTVDTTFPELDDSMAVVFSTTFGLIISPEMMPLKCRAVETGQPFLLFPFTEESLPPTATAPLCSTPTPSNVDLTPDSKSKTPRSKRQAKSIRKGAKPAPAVRPQPKQTAPSESDDFALSTHHNREMMQFDVSPTAASDRKKRPGTYNINAEPDYSSDSESESNK